MEGVERTMTDQPAVAADDTKLDDRIVEVATDRQIFADVYPALRRFAAVVGSMDIEPDDLVQAAVVRALGGGPLSRFDSPEAYLRRTIVNLASNDRRRFGRRRRAMTRFTGGWTETDTDHYPSDLAELGQLPPSTRAVLYLREVEGYGYDDIAQMLGVTAASARMTASRALKALRSASNSALNSAKDPS